MLDLENTRWKLVKFCCAERVVRMHLVPNADLREHELGEACWCKPEEDDESEVPFWVHNSADNRERFEALPLQ
jgi:hypothetical protein